MLQVDLTSEAADRATKSREFSSHAILNPTKDFLESLETCEGKRKHRSPRYSFASLARKKCAHRVLSHRLLFYPVRGWGGGGGWSDLRWAMKKKWHEIATKKSTRHQVITLQLFTLFTYLGLLLLPQAQIFVHRF